MISQAYKASLSNKNRPVSPFLADLLGGLSCFFSKDLNTHSDKKEYLFAWTVETQRK